MTRRLPSYERRCPGCQRWYPEQQTYALYQGGRYCLTCWETLRPLYALTCQSCGREYTAGPRHESWLCPTCMWRGTDRERHRVRHQLSRARAVKAPATLTVVEWLMAISDFDGLCAYCLAEDFTLLEHYQAIEVAGTVASNVVPACACCNARKRTGVHCIPSQALERVGNYLATVAAPRASRIAQLAHPSGRPSATGYNADDQTRALALDC